MHAKLSPWRIILKPDVQLLLTIWNDKKKFLFEQWRCKNVSKEFCFIYFEKSYNYKLNLDMKCDPGASGLM